MYIAAALLLQYSCISTTNIMIGRRKHTPEEGTLPSLSGLEVLREIRASHDSNLHTVPVVVLTTSTAAQDVTRAYEQHANSYLVKPVDFAQFMQLMHDLGFYWLGWNYYAVA